VYTYLVVKEDALTLYGFATTDERDTFATLMGAKGVGAKLALAMLAVHTPDALRQAIAAKDTAALTRVPGLGPKGAQRVILDVGDKLGPLRGEGELEFDLPAATDEANPQVVAALVGLGWNEAVATGAVAQVTTAPNATDVSAPPPAAGTPRAAPPPHRHTGRRSPKLLSRQARILLRRLNGIIRNTRRFLSLRSARRNLSL